jgi:hypothetical protein
MSPGTVLAAAPSPYPPGLPPMQLGPEAAERVLDSSTFWITMALEMAPLLLIVAFVFLAYWIYFRRIGRHFSRQASVGERVVEQNKYSWEMVAAQYKETNARSDRALAISERALEVQSAALDELKGLREAVSRLSAASGGATGQ